jgi:MFS family permease
MGAYLAILPRLLPRSKYGQFFTANQIFGFVGVALAPVLCGGLLEFVKDYRFVYVWCGTCTLGGFVMCSFLYRHWMRLGGDHGYRPPGFEHDSTTTAIRSAH